MSKPKRQLDVYDFREQVTEAGVDDEFNHYAFVVLGDSHFVVTGVRVDSDGDLIVEAR